MIEILQQIENNAIDDNPLLAEIIDLALYQFISLLFFYSSRLTPLFDERYNKQQINQNQKQINWTTLVKGQKHS